MTGQSQFYPRLRDGQSALSVGAVATCDRVLETATGAAPEWVHLLPLGAVEGRDGRSWSLNDAKGVVADFQARKVDLPVDFDHQMDKPDPGRTGPVPAAGWIKSLKVMTDGIWGHVVWTARASELISAKEYRYISPVFHHLKDGSIIRLTGAGLVHNPNLHLTALAAQEDTMTADMTLMQRLAALLKLPPETDANTILAALEKVLAQPATPDPKDYVPATAMAELLRDRNAHIAMQAEATANTRVADAIRTGHIIPAMREWATALCTQDPDSFETFIRQSAPAYAHLTRPLNFGKAPPPYAKTHDSDVAAAICTQLGLPPGSLNT